MELIFAKIGGVFDFMYHCLSPQLGYFSRRPSGLKRNKGEREREGGNKEGGSRGWPFQGSATISWMIILSVFRRRVPITRRLRETVEKRPSSAGLRSKEVARSGGEGSGRLLLAVQGEEGRGERKEKESNSPRELLPKQATHDGDPPRGNPISFCPLARPNRVTRFETSPRTRIRSLCPFAPASLLISIGIRRNVPPFPRNLPLSLSPFVYSTSSAKQIPSGEVD